MGSPPRRILDRELAKLQDDLQQLGELIIAAITRAVEALTQGDCAQARTVVDDDRRVNALRFHIEEECLALIATQQPAASDLRRVLSAINMAGDMERMGDHAAGIAKTVLRLHGLQPADQVRPHERLTRMAELCCAMVTQSMRAFRTWDTELARQVATHDDELDRLNREVVEHVLAYMIENPQHATAATYQMWCAHNLERIGDRATNISERVIFMTTGTMQELNQ